ncbi:MAG TPA: hypothetical protein VKE94_16145 [Gemmataceae bacterium]|nr:hypothetical protein [Gemmataceae bacterium]
MAEFRVLSRFHSIGPIMKEQCETPDNWLSARFLRENNKKQLDK